MKRVLIVSIALILAISLNAQQTGTFKDSRDGKTYKKVKIGKQVWMAENLTYKPISGNYWAYENNSSNVANYGYLYDWQTAKKVCPTGWHLPSKAEWTQLENFLGSNAGTVLKSKSGWRFQGNGTDDYGFSALPGGSYETSKKLFHELAEDGAWWCSTDSADYAWSTHMWSESSNAHKVISGNIPNVYGLSVRCVMDYKMEEAVEAEKQYKIAIEAEKQRKIAVEAEKQRKVSAEAEKKRIEAEAWRIEAEAWKAKLEDEKLPLIITVNGRKLEVHKQDFLGKMNWNDARLACQSLGNGWRLPTKEELEQIYWQLYKKGKGNFYLGYYWSSTEKSTDNAWALFFHFNDDGGVTNPPTKAAPYNVRAVRDF
jgi:uncharacterized protein (TIGR02145 family)